MLRYLSKTLQTDVLITETSDFLKQIIIVKSFNSVFYVIIRTFFYNFSDIHAVSTEGEVTILLLCRHFR